MVNVFRRLNNPIPSVLTVTGGLAHEATIFYTRTSGCPVVCKVEGWLLSNSRLALMLLKLSLFHSVIHCIRGARSSINAYSWIPLPVDVVTVESQLSIQLNAVMLFSSVLFICPTCHLCWGWSAWTVHCNVTVQLVDNLCSLHDRT